MHLKVFLKLKKTLKTLSSGKIYKKNPKTPKNPKKPQKPKKKTTGLVFFKPGFFPTLPVGVDEEAGGALMRLVGGEQLLLLLLVRHLHFRLSVLLIRLNISVTVLIGSGFKRLKNFTRKGKNPDPEPDSYL
jgi:hypothetical protein